MPKTTAAFSRDANFVPIVTDGLLIKRTITFDGATAGGWGNDGGALDGGVIFTVTGGVRLQSWGICKTNLAGSGTHAVGISGDTAIYMPAEAAADINADDFVINQATVTDHPILGEAIAAADNFPMYALNGQDIIMTIAGGADIDSGVIDYYAIFVPMSDTGNVVATTD